MAVKYGVEEMLGLEEKHYPTYETIAESVALEFQFDILEKLDELKMTQRDLSQMMGITPPSLSSLLRKGANLTIKSMARIARALGFKITAPKLVSMYDMSASGNGAGTFIEGIVTQSTGFSFMADEPYSSEEIREVFMNTAEKDQATCSSLNSKGIKNKINTKPDLEMAA